jgi:hypothetical protein
MPGEKIKFNKLLIKNGDFSWDASNMFDKSLQKNITKKWDQLLQRDSSYNGPIIQWDRSNGDQ